MTWEDLPIPAAEIANARLHGKRLARSMQKTLPYWVDTEVLENEADLAVVRAAERWRADGGASFTTWAATVVQRSLLEEVRRQSPWTRLQRQLRRENMESGNDPEGWMLPPLSFEHLPKPLHDEEMTLEEVLPDDRAEFTEECELRAVIRPLIQQIEPRRRYVLIRYYWHQESTREIAERMGVSISRVQQLRMQALGTVRAHLAPQLPPRPDEDAPRRQRPRIGYRMDRKKRK